MYPNLITRYVFWELTKIFLVSSFAFVALMLLLGVADEARDRGLGPEILIQLIPYIFPKALMFAMPATCLFSVCVVFGRMAADHEMTAIKSLGLHQSVIVYPVLVVAFLLSLFAVWVNDVSFAWSYWGIEKVVLESSDKILYGVLREQGSFKTERFSIEVDGVEGRRLIQPVITYYAPGNEHYRAVADEATLTTAPAKHSLLFTMRRGAITSDGDAKTTVRFDSELQHPIPLKSPEEIAKATGNPSHLYLSQIGDEIQDQSQSLKRQERADAIRAVSQMLTGDLIGLTNAEWQDRLTDQVDARARLDRLHVVPHRRWANGFSCLAFAMVGIPVALRLRSSNYPTTFFVCFLPILIVYYPLFMFGLTGAKEGTLPPMAAWLGNAVCVLAGAWMMHREFRR